MFATDSVVAYSMIPVTETR